MLNLKLIDKVVKMLGDPYIIKFIDTGEVIYRKLDNNYEFEVCIIFETSCTLYVWSTTPHILVGVYTGISINYLMDVLGYYACLYQKLTDQFQVERQDIEL